MFETLNSSRRWWAEASAEDFVFVSREAALYLTDRGVRIVGADYLSVGGFYKAASRLAKRSSVSAPGSSKD